MDFSQNDDIKGLAELSAKIFSEQCTPERLTKQEKEGGDFYAQLAAIMADAGLLGASIDEQYGGSGLGFEALCATVEAMGRDISLWPLDQIVVGGPMAIQRFANEDSKQNWLPAVATGKTLLTCAYVEPSNEDMSSPQLLYRETEAGGVLTGAKHMVPLAEHADGIVVSAMSDDGPVICITSAKAGGVSLSDQWLTTGEQVSKLDFKDTPVQELLVQGAPAQEWLLWVEQRLQVAACATAVGVCDKMMRMTASYTSEREQFGRAVATFQGVAHRMADCYIDVECLRLVTQQAVSLLHAEEPADEAVLVAKIWAGDVCHRVSQAAQHCHGGIGVDRDYPLHRYCLKARQLELSFGSSAKLQGALADQIAAAY